MKRMDLIFNIFFSKLFLLAIKLGIGVLAAKFAISKLKSFGGHVSEGVSKGFNSFKDLALNFTELMNKNKLQNEENEEGNIEKSSFLDKFKNLFNLKNVFDIGLLYSMISSKDCSLS